jgi:pimeloyl-ACP methyl ester carboxylesterase
MKTILIHGAGLGAWVWESVLPHIDSQSLAVDLPMRGDTSAVLLTLSLEDYVQSVIKQLRQFPTEKFLLVGHSVGGEIALRLNELLPGRVAGIVLLSAIVPPPGKSMLSLQPWIQRQVMRLMFRLGKVVPPEKIIRAANCNDLDETACLRLVNKYSPESPRLFLDPVAWTHEGLPPCLYVKTLKDRSLLPLMQDVMISRVNPMNVETLDCGHLSMLAKPKELGKLLSTFIHSLQTV